MGKVLRLLDVFLCLLCLASLGTDRTLDNRAPLDVQW